MWLLLLFALLSSSGAFRLREIVENCRGDYGNLLHAGTTHRFRYVARGRSEVFGAAPDASSLELKCKVLLSHHSACFYQLQVEDCTVKSYAGPPNQEKPLLDERPWPTMSKHAILFSLVRGSLQTILTHSEDPLPELNLKRGIISLFGVPRILESRHRKEHDHLDVRGLCPREVTREGNVINVWSKSLGNCRHPSKLDWQLSPMSLFWNMSFVQTIINSTTSCRYLLTQAGDKEILSRATCHERHASQLYSSQQSRNSEQTNLFYTLEHLGSDKSGAKKNPRANEVRIAKIAYEYERTPDPVANPVDFKVMAESLLTDLVLESRRQVHLSNIQQYLDFLDLLRSGHDLLPFVQSVMSCGFLKGASCNDTLKERGKQFLQSALIQCNTIACMKAVTHLAVYEHISPAYLNLVLYSWTNLVVNKHQYLDEILAICMNRDLRICWLSLGNIISNYVERSPSSKKLPKAIHAATDYLGNFLKEACSSKMTGHPPGYSKLQKADYLRARIKAIGNMGPVALTARPDLMSILETCVQNVDLHPNPRVASIESLERLHRTEAVHVTLVALLLNESQDVEVRQMAYLALVQNLGHQDDLAEVLALLIKSERVTQVKTYVVSHLRNVRGKSRPSENEKRFLKQLEEALSTHAVDLDDTYVDTDIHSHNKQRLFHFENSGLPEDQQEFGLNWEYDALYSPGSSRPYTIARNLTLQLFSRVVDILEAGITMKDWESFDIWRHRLSTDAPSLMKWLEENAFEVMRRFGLMGELPPLEPEVAYISESIRDSLRMLRESYYLDKHSFYPSLMMHLKMFGNEIHFATLQDILSALQEKYYEVATKGPMGALRTGADFNSYKAFGLVEGVYHLPTMMGAPLNWTLNVTAMWGVEGRFKADLGATLGTKPAFSGALEIHPSLVVTAVTGMVLDLPQVTKVGVRTNCSIYSATNWNLEILYSEPASTRQITLARPSKPQHYLEFYHTIQLVRHDHHAELSDPADSQRVQHEDCTLESTSKVLGFQACIRKSYVNVTFDMTKPWFLLAGRSEWSLTSNPFDPELKAYKLGLGKPSLESNNFALEARFEGPGAFYRREVDISLNYKKNTGEHSVVVKVPEAPEFELSARVEREENVRQYEAQNSYLVKLADTRKYLVSYKNKVVRKSAADINSPVTQNWEMTFDTPNNVASLKSHTVVIRDNVTADLEANFTNKNGQGHWTPNVLPTHWFENARHAWVKVHADLKELNPSKHNYHKKAKLETETPEHRVTLQATLRRDAPWVRGYEFWAGKEVKATKKLLTFLSGQVGLNRHNKGRSEITSGFANLTSYWLSIAANFKSDNSPEESTVTFTANRIKLMPKTEEAQNFIGFWTPRQNDLFTSDDRFLKFRLHAVRSPGQLPGPARALYQPDAPHLWGQKSVVESALVYRLHDRKHSVTMRGTFTVFFYNDHFLSWERDYSIFSSSSEVELKTSGFYVRSRDHETGDIELLAALTYVPTGGKAVYRLQSKRFRRREDDCVEFRMSHTLSSDLLDFTGNHSLDCYPGNLAILLKTRSRHWDRLNFDLNQTAAIGPRGNEKMEYSGPLTKAMVVGDWDFSRDNYTYNKYLTVNSHSELVPSLKAGLHIQGNGSVQISAEIPAINLRQIKMERWTEGSGSKIIRTISHIDLDTGEEHRDVYIKVKLYHPTAAMVRVSIQPAIFNRLFWFYRDRLEAALETTEQVFKDAQHPLNVMLEPYLGGTVMEWLGDVQAHIGEDAIYIGKDVIEAFTKLSPFFHPYIKPHIENLKWLRDHRKDFCEWWKRNTLSGWAYEYFEFPQMLEHQWESRDELPHHLETSMRKFFEKSMQDRVFYFQLTGQHPFLWPSGHHYPQWSRERFVTWSGMNLLQDELSIPAIPTEKTSRTAAIFGSHHVITFDGRTYEFPEYPGTRCEYLLAHDVRGASFSIVVSSTTVMAIFPEVTVQVTYDNKILINGFRNEQEVPYQSINGKVKVTREGPVIKVETLDLLILCITEQEVCTFKVGPLYLGGIIGILGNADGQEFNDFLLPNGKITADLASFAAAYAVSNDATCRQLAPRPPQQWTAVERETCANLLSPSRLLLQSCTASLGLDWETPCLWDLRHGHDTCPTGAGLAAICSLHGLRLRPDDRCAAKQGLLHHITKITKTLEVVFIVNQHTSLFPTGLKGLDKLTRALEEVFRRQEYSSITFGLVGFGEKTAEARIVSPTSRLLVDHEELISKSLRLLAFSSEEEANVVDAIRYTATMMVPASNSTRIYLLFTAEDSTFDFKKCGVRSFQQCVMPTVQTAAQKYTRLGRLATALKSRGDVVYTFARYPALEERGLFGARSEEITIPRRDTPIDYPGGDGAQLAALTGGAVFQQGLLEGANQEDFFTQVAQEILQDSSRLLGQCRDCKPEFGSFWNLRPSCLLFPCPN